MDITRLKDKYVSCFDKGDEIVISEKIDGANFSFRYDEESNCIAAFSRKTQLDYNNTLRGAWGWVQQLDVNKVKDVLSTDLIVFAEFLVPHTVRYPQDKYQKPYVFDVFNITEGKYLTQDKAHEIANKLGMTYVPIFYKGEFISWEHIQSFVGKTELGGEYGEGVVIKNMTKLNNPDTRQPFYIKIVGEQFQETKPMKQKLPVDTKLITYRTELVESIVTPARVTKLVHKLIDAGVIREDWDEHDLGVIAKNIGKLTYEDCMKEEPDVVKEAGDNFGKIAHRTAMKIVRSMI